MKKTLLSIASAAALLGTVASPAAASTFHLVVPLNRPQQATPAPPAEDPIAVSLASATLAKAYVDVPYSESLRPYLSVTGDATFDPAVANWRLAGGSLPAGLTLDSSTGAVAGKPTSSLPASTNFDAAVAYKGESAQQTYALHVGIFEGSCKTLIQAHPGLHSGWYTLDVDGAGPATAQSYYCDMTRNGGGWTRIVRQTEVAPVTAWTGGVNSQSYVLSAVQIPPHTQTAFGKDGDATFIAYVNWKYTTGEIAPVTVSNPDTGAQYMIYRYKDKFYGNHDPRTTLYNAMGIDSQGTWANSLSIVATSSPLGPASVGWAFSPLNETEHRRGFRMQTAVGSTYESYAWTVWVR